MRIRVLGRALCAWALAGAVIAGPGHARAASPENSSAPAMGSLVGVVVAHQALDLTPQGEGRLQKIEVSLGDRVTAGQVLAVLELEPLQLEVNARHANLQAADAEIHRTQVLLNQAKQRLGREKQISPYTAAEVVETAQNDVLLATANLELTQARRAEAAARLEQARRALENARVRAPFAGRVTERYQALGAMVGRTTPLFRLVSDDLRLRFAVPESLASSVRPGSTLQVFLPALGATLQGKVDNLAPEVDPASRHQKAEARLTIPDGLRDQVAVGLLAEVRPEPATAVSRPTP